MAENPCNDLKMASSWHS